MVSIKFISESQLTNNSLVEKELFGVRETKCIYIRESGKNRKLLSADFNGRYTIGDYMSDYKLDINDDNGECLKLWNNKLIREVQSSSTFKINENGYLEINSSGNQIWSNSLLKLSQPLESISGGTGFNSFTKGDMVIGNSLGSLSKMSSANINNKYFLLKDKDSEIGVSYGLDIFEEYYYMSPPDYISLTNYSIDKIQVRDYQLRDTISINNINLNVFSTIIEESSTAVSVYPFSTDLDIPAESIYKFKYGDIISLKDSRITTSSGVQTITEYRKITNVNTQLNVLTLDSSFSLLNNWSLNGTASLSTTQFRFGSKSLACTATTTFARLITNSSLDIGNTWTVEMFVRLNVVNAAQSIIISNTANTFRINFINGTPRFRISLGQGASYNIANNLSGSTAVVANTWYHVAVVKTTTNYLFFVGGVLQNTINSTLAIPVSSLQNLKLGGDSSLLNGFIDEFRLSSINRYTAAFTTPSAIFSLDDRTISLNHFDGSAIGESDDRVNNSIVSNQFIVNKDGYLYKNSVFYLYVYRKYNNDVNALAEYVKLSTRNNEDEFIPLINNIANEETVSIKRLPFYITISSVDSVPHSTLLCGRYFDIHPNISLVSNLSNTAEAVTSLYNFLPIYTKRIRIMITHAHVGTIECSISVGTRSELKNNYLTTNVASITSLTIDIPIINLQLISNLSVLASTTSYSIVLLGYFC